MWLERVFVATGFCGLSKCVLLLMRDCMLFDLVIIVRLFAIAYERAVDLSHGGE